MKRVVESRRLTAIVLLMTVLVGFAIASAPATARSTNKAQLQVWTVNLRKMGHLGPNVWRKFVNRVHKHNVKPDLIALTEICNQDRGGIELNDVHEFIVYLEGITGDQFDYVHSGDPGTPCEDSNSMVVWRKKRFELGKRPNLVRWASYTEANKDGNVFCSRSDGHTLTQIAVALRDKLQKKTLVFSSVHIPVRNSFTCINENISQIDRNLERLRGLRRLSIVAGDLNQMPQREAGTPGDEQLVGTQTDPSCWYRSLNMLTVDDLGSCMGKRWHSPEHYDEASDHYLDAVHVQHLGPAPGTSQPSICDEWTHNRKYATRGTACTDLSGKDDVPDGLTDRGRIDYIWARWERPNGNALPIEATNAPSLITKAATDQASPPRYSDHKAVRALIEWCLPIDPC